MTGQADPADITRFLARFVSEAAGADPSASRAAANLRTRVVAMMPDVVRDMRITPGPDTDAAAVRAEIVRALIGRPAKGVQPVAPDADLVEALLDEMVGLGPLEALRRDPDVTDILVNRYDDVHVERNGRLEAAPVAFVSENHFLSLVHRLVGRAGRRVDQASPIADALLPDGSRLNIVLPPLSVNGPTMSLRRHATRNLSMPQLVSAGSLSFGVSALLVLAVKARWNILITGGAGAGKTTLLNAMSAYVEPGERVITVEDVAELQLRQRHVVRLQTRPASLEGGGEVTLRDLVRQTLRMRSDRVIVGEVRGPEAWDMLTAMNTGAQGSLGTLHANRPLDAMLRLEGLVALANPTLGLSAIRSNIASALDLVVHVARFTDGVRRITDIDEVGVAGDDGIGLRPLYRYRGGRLGAAATGTETGDYFPPSPGIIAAAEGLQLQELLTAFTSAGTPSGSA